MASSTDTKMDPWQALRVTRDHQGFISTVEMHRPEALNAVDTAMSRELIAVFESFLWDPTLRVVILTGYGERAFCVGADMKERGAMSDEEWHAQHQVTREVFTRILRCPVPVVAAVEGHALGGGCELAAACDFIVAGEGASFALPEVTRGIFPGGGGTQYLPRRIGLAMAKELIFTGRRVEVAEAKALGLVNHVVPAGHARAHAQSLAATMAENAPLAIRQAKKALNWGSETDLWTGLTLSFEAWSACARTHDRTEGVRAFNEKRKPRFQGK